MDYQLSELGLVLVTVARRRGPVVLTRTFVVPALPHDPRGVGGGNPPAPPLPDRAELDARVRAWEAEGREEPKS